MPSEENTVVTTTSPTMPPQPGSNKGAAATGAVSTAAASKGGNGSSEGADGKIPTTPITPTTTTPSFDPTEYVQKQRVTKMTPPKPAYNPLQFIQIKPCNLYQSAQDQLRKAEEVKKSKITKKEEAEDWQGNLDSWKSSRRKRVEHIIERVVEVKKLEIEEHDRTRKKSKTFSEMMEERGSGSGRRKVSIPVYAEDESNDLSDLGIGTSSASGKSSLSEDFDNHSVISDNPDTEKSSDVDHNERNGTRPASELSYRENISSPGYETCSSNAPTTSPDPSDYACEMKRYQDRQLGATVRKGSKESTPDRFNGGGGESSDNNKFVPKRLSGTKIEDRLVNFELKSSASTDASDNMTNGNGQVKKDLPKVDITKRREMFEKEKSVEKGNRSSGDFTQAAPLMSIKERLCNLEKQKEETTTVMQNGTATNRLSGDITSIKQRLRNLEKETTPPTGANKFDIPFGGSIKDRLSSLHSSVATTNGSTGGTVDASEQATPKSAVVVGMAKKSSPPPVIDTDLVIEVETLKIEIEQINLTAPVPMVTQQQQPESLISTMDSIQDAVQEYVTIVQDVKMAAAAPSIREKEEYREITDEDLFGGTDIDMDADVEIDNLQQDMSVLEALDIAFEAIDKDGVAGGGIDDTLLPLSDHQNITTLVAVAAAAAADASSSPAATTTSTSTTTITTTSFFLPPSSKSTTDLDVATRIAVAEIAVADAAPTTTNPNIALTHDTTDCSNHSDYDDVMDRNGGDTEPFINDLIKQKCGGQQAAVEEDAPTIDSIIYEAERDAESLQVEPNIQPVMTTKSQTLNFVADAEAEPIYEIIEDVSQPKPLKSALKSPSKKKATKKKEPNVDTDVKRDVEPYYEVPQRNPIPLYENVDIFLASVNETNQGEMLSTIPAGVHLQPPKMKPPPPPVESELESDGDDVDEGSVDGEITPEENLKRMNSTKRIKKQIRNQRSSFLGIQSSQDDDELELKLTVAPPPNMSELIEEERRLEKQFLKTYDGIERSDSGVSESHSRQSSEPFTGSSEEHDDRTKELEQEGRHGEWIDDVRMQNIEEQIREQEEVLRVERELLQIEQEELKRQRANLLLRENFARKELSHGANRLSLQDINQNMAVNEHRGMPSNHVSSSASSSTDSSSFNVTSPVTYSMQAPISVPVDYRQSMPDLQSSLLMESTGHVLHPGFGHPNNNNNTNGGVPVGLTPPAKPSRQMAYINNGPAGNHSDYQNVFARSNKAPSANDLCDDFVQLRDHHQQQQQHPIPQHQSPIAPTVDRTQQIGNMSRHTLHALSAVPKPKLTDVWVQQQAVGRKSESIPPPPPVGNNNNNKYFPIQRKAPITAHERMSGEPWIARKSDAPKGLGYGKHWLIQEAEQRRLDQQRGVRPTPNPQNWSIKSAGHLHRKSMPDISGSAGGVGVNDKKPLPDAVINTITQRLQSRMSVGNVVDKKRFDANPAIINSNASLDEGQVLMDNNNHGDMRIPRSQEHVLSVSGKKKCSHCDEELGRGAAMIVESLRLFYHIDCFKCCVCLIRLGDGLNGTDVRVRNHKLHCQNCYSSDDGIKFSCV